MSGRILIIDQVATNRIVLKVRLVTAHYDVVTASCMDEGLDATRTAHPDLIIVAAQSDNLAGPEICALLRAVPDAAETPLIILTDSPDDAQTLACLQAGAHDVLPRALPQAQFLAHIRRVLRTSASDYELRLRETTNRALGFAEDDAPFIGRPKALVILDAPDAPPAWCTALVETPALSVRVLGRDQAKWTKATTDMSDVFILPLLDGEHAPDLSIITALRSAPSTRNVAIVAVLNRDNPALISMALDLGADDLIFEDSPLTEICLRISRQARRKHTAERLRARVKDGLTAAVTDPLTGLYNRRYAMPHLDQMAKTAQTTAKPYALMMLDLDRFKQVNDTFGHPAGDAVLVEVAKRLQNNLRAVDLIARVGGEEFLIAMPQSSLAQAKTAANRLRRIICGTPVQLSDQGLAIDVSISIGLSMGGGTGRLAETSHVLQLADNALNQAKCDGRNTVTVSKTAA